MSQSTANTGLPTPTTTQDWTIIPDEVIQSASKDDKETADMNYAKHQCQKQVRKDTLLVTPGQQAATQYMSFQQEACEAQERDAITMAMGGRGPADEQVARDTGRRQLSTKCTSTGRRLKNEGPCTQCIRAELECTFKLAKAKCGNHVKEEASTRGNSIAKGQ
ncbi:hypothetical protein EDC04DRAFT_3016405 [Pisolithus marmoratus]|nr:hypothetical protein EDC04DRAFT_3016405 [Pisolithus marmoratus]